MATDRIFPNHVKWVFAFIGAHWILFVATVITKSGRLMFFFGSPLLFPNIREIWVPFFPGRSAHLVIFFNSIIAGVLFWFLVKLIAADSRSARDAESPPRRWPTILSICASNLLLVIFFFLASVIVAAPTSGGDPQVIIPTYASLGLTMTWFVVGIGAVMMIAMRKVSMKWHRPLLVLIAVLAVLIASFFAFSPPAGG